MTWGSSVVISVQKWLQMATAVSINSSRSGYITVPVAVSCGEYNYFHVKWYGICNQSITPAGLFDSLWCLDSAVLILLQRERDRGLSTEPKENFEISANSARRCSFPVYQPSSPLKDSDQRLKPSILCITLPAAVSSSFSSSTSSHPSPISHHFEWGLHTSWFRLVPTPPRTRLACVVKN